MPATLRVMTFNVAFGAGAGGIPAVISHLRGLPRADILCLQECDRGTRRYGAGDHAQMIAQGANYPFWRAGGYLRHYIKLIRVPFGWEGGKAVLSPHPISGFEELAVTDASGNLMTWVIAARITVRGLEHVVYVTHWPRDEAGWTATRDFAAGLADRDPPDRFVIVAGDFNTTADDPGMWPLMDRFGHPATEIGDSSVCDQRLGERLIDHVLYRGTAYKASRYSEHCDLPHPSDHRSVEVAFTDTRPEAPECDGLRTRLAAAQGRYREESSRQYQPPRGPVRGIDPARTFFESQKRQNLARIQSEIDGIRTEMDQHGCL